MSKLIVVADMYKMPLVRGKYNKDLTEKVREGIKITKRHAERMNSMTKQNGLYYVVNEKATEQWREKHNAQVNQRKKADKLERDAATALAHAVQGVRTHSARLADEPDPPAQEDKLEKVPAKEEEKPKYSKRKTFGITTDLELVDGPENEIGPRFESKELIAMGKRADCEALIEDMKARQSQDK